MLLNIRKLELWQATVRVQDIVARFLAVFDRAKTMPDTNKTKLRDANSPMYCKLAARITPLTIGPSVCPTSIMVLRNPIDAPIKLEGTISLISGDVEEITAAKPIPYATERSNSIGNCVVNGTANKIRQLATDPVIIGMRLLVLSETLPIKGLVAISATIWLPWITPMENASNPTISVK